jgi:hypothetical protein
VGCGPAATGRAGGRALRLAGAAHALCEALGTRPLRTEQIDLRRRLEAARGLLGEPAAEAAWAEGKAMPLERAMADALEAAPPPTT